MILSSTKKMWLVRCVGCSLVVFVILKFSESWIFDLSDGENGPQTLEHSTDDVEKDPLVSMRRHERAHFLSHREPPIRNRLCDTCRIVAHNFDLAFEAAEEKLLGKLKTKFPTRQKQQYQSFPVWGYALTEWV